MKKLGVSFMDTQVGLIFKVFILSAGFSILIKYGGPMVPLAPTQIVALTAISLPTLVMALALWWRSQNNRPLQ